MNRPIQLRVLGLMRKSGNQDCALCRVMRSMAFSGAGGAIGAIGALLIGASRQNIMLSALVVAAIFVFAFAVKKKD